MRTMWRAASVLVVLGCMLTVSVPRADAASQSFSKDQLSQLVAPIALYPDSLLTQILMASTYPTEVVDADRWLKAHSTLTLTQQQQQLGSQTWDPSVISLVAFPDVLSRMSANLDWTEALGEAFLAQKNDVLNAVQQMRGMAAQAGNLQSTQQMTVANSGGYYSIAPPNDTSVYLPLYDPATVYGTTWSAGSWFWPGAMVAPVGWTAGRPLAFASGVAVGSAMFGTVNWNTRAVAVNGNYWNNPAYRTAAGNSIYARNGSVNVNNSKTYTHNGNTTTVNRNTNATGYGNSGTVNRNTSVTHNGNTVATGNRSTTATGYGNSASVNRSTNWQYDNAHRQGTNFQNPSLQKSYSTTTNATRGYGSASVTRTSMPGSTSIPYTAPAASVTGTRSTGFGSYGSASSEARASSRGAYSTGSAGAGFNRSFNSAPARSVNFGGGRGRR